MMKLISVLFKKEVLDASRDKRSVMAGLYYCIGAPILMCVLFTVMFKQMASPDALKITIKNAENAPNLVQFLASKEIEHGEGEEVKAITLEVSEDYQENMTQGKSATVFIIADKSEQKLRSSINRLERNLMLYNSEVASLRLVARGIDPTIARAIDVQTHDQATPTSKGGFVLGIATLSIIISLFYAAMGMAIDSSAGERERNSLQLLLSHPISTMHIVLAKVGAIAGFSIIALVLTTIVSKFAYNMVPWEMMGFTVVIGPKFIISAIIIGLPIALMSASLLIFISFLAKSFKEAQSYVAMALFIPVMMSMATTYDIATDIMQWMPIAAQQNAMIEIIKGNAIPVPQLLLSSAVTLGLFAIFTYLSSRMLKSEKVVFGL
ncbi:ABC transporter permease [Pseudoalteromonas piscicida]|uniref:ABC transporter permease n=1 Tax=Pseudoalteromonas piscicida TaxID=43662 RepID=UPI000E35AE59|nr:ABC transporter permease [Pseudoalteromonas piscicida]AXQ97662.1 ABC transporter permease [Pseudoalteromonas piscicida]